MMQRRPPAAPAARTSRPAASPRNAWPVTPPNSLFSLAAPLCRKPAPTGHAFFTR